MAVDRKIKDTRIMRRKGKQAAGEPASTGQLSDDRKRPDPRSADRGIGSSYAMAVGNVLEQSAEMKKGSQSGFLGESSETMDIKQIKV